MRTTLQILLWVGLVYVTYKKMYPDGLPSLELKEEPTEPNHRTDKTTKNSPAHTTTKKLKAPSTKSKNKRAKKQR